MNNIEYIMLNIGCPAHLRGYNATYLAVKHLIDDPAITKIGPLYDKVADDLHISNKCVERNIRHLVDYLFKKGNVSKMRDYFGSTVIDDGHMCNKQFLWTLARRTLEMEGVNADYKR